LDLLVYRNSRNINIAIYIKPTETGTVIHLASNHPLEQKISAFHYYINRLITRPIMEQSKQKEWEKILAIARNNGYPVTVIQSLKAKLIKMKKQKQTQQQQEATVTRNKWVAFTCTKSRCKNGTRISKMFCNCTITVLINSNVK
jgi:hypothetical protein